MNKSKTGGDLKDLVIIFNLDSNIDQPSGITTFDKVINRLSNNQQTPVYTLLKGFDLIAMEIDPDLTPNKIISKIEDESNSKVYLANNSSLINYKSVIFYFRTIMLESNYSSFISKVLLPFILIRTRYSKEDSSPIKDKLRFLLCIDNQAGSRSYHKLSHDMLIETMIEQKHWKKNEIIIDDNTKVLIVDFTNDKSKQCYVINRDKSSGEKLEPQMLQVHGVGLLHTRIPWLVLSDTAYKVLSDHVLSIFKTPESLKPQEKIDFVNDVEKILKNRNIDLFKAGEERIFYQETIIRTGIKRTCQGMISDFINDFPEVDRHTKELERLHDYCKNLSLLSFLFILAFLTDESGTEDEKSIKKGPKQEGILSERELLKLVNTSQDFATGVLQLIENAVLYAGENALLSFSIKKTKDTNVVDYKNSYNSNKFLEVKIVDYNNETIPETFKNKLPERNRNKALINIDLKLEDFFDSNSNAKEGWNSYYQDIQNINHHYGLNHFLNTVKKGKGSFQVISSLKGAPGSDEIFERDFNNETMSLPQAIDHLPGTEYSITMPIFKSDDEITLSSGTGLTPDFNDDILKRKVNYIC